VTFTLLLLLWQRSVAESARAVELSVARADVARLSDEAEEARAEAASAVQARDEAREAAAAQQADAEAAISAAREQSAALAAQVERLSAEQNGAASEAAAELDTLRERLAGTEQQLASAKDDLASNEDKLSAAHAEVAETAAQQGAELQRLQVELDRALADLEGFGELHDATVAEVVDLRAQLGARTADVEASAGHGEELADVQRKLQVAETAQQEAAAQLRDSRADAERLKEQLTAPAAGQAEVTAQAQAAGAAHGDELSAAQSRTSQLETELETRTEKAAGLQAQLTDAEGQQQQLRTELAAAKKALGAAQAKVAGLEAAAAHSAKVLLRVVYPHCARLKWIPSAVRSMPVQTRS